MGLIGETVLLRISGMDDSALVRRPLLVVSERAGTVAGRLLLDWDADKRSWWAHHQAKFVHDGEAWVAGVEHGSDPGEFLLREELQS
jgi:hypothetical protein